MSSSHPLSCTPAVTAALIAALNAVSGLWADPAEPVCVSEELRLGAEDGSAEP